MEACVDAQIDVATTTIMCQPKQRLWHVGLNTLIINSQREDVITILKSWIDLKSRITMEETEEEEEEEEPSPISANGRLPSKKESHQAGQHAGHGPYRLRARQPSSPAAPAHPSPSPNAHPPCLLVHLHLLLCFFPPCLHLL